MTHLTDLQTDILINTLGFSKYIYRKKKFQKKKLGLRECQPIICLEFIFALKLYASVCSICSYKHACWWLQGDGCSIPVPPRLVLLHTNHPRTHPQSQRVADPRLVDLSSLHCNCLCRHPSHLVSQVLLKLSFELELLIHFE